MSGREKEAGKQRQTDLTDTFKSNYPLKAAHTADWQCTVLQCYNIG